MPAVDVEELAGTVFGLMGVVMALVHSHPNPGALLESIRTDGSAVLAMMATSKATPKSRDAARGVLERLERLISERNQGDTGTPGR